MASAQPTPSTKPRPTDSAQISIATALFSKTQRQVLGLVYGNPDKSYYVKEIVRYAGVGIGSVQRVLEKLEKAGLIVSSRVGNQKHFRANHQCPIYEDVVNIVSKTTGVPTMVPLGIDEDDLLLIGGQEPVSRKRFMSASKRHHVAYLAWIRSRARAGSGPQKAIDLLVEFSPGREPDAEDMARIETAFSTIFIGRKVGLITRAMFRDPQRPRRANDEELQVLYSAER